MAIKSEQEQYSGLPKSLDCTDSQEGLGPEGSGQCLEEMHCDLEVRGQAQRTGLAQARIPMRTD